MVNAKDFIYIWNNGVEIMATVKLNTIKNTDITSDSVKVLGTMSYTNNSSTKEIAKRVDILVDGAIDTTITLTKAQSSFNTQPIDVLYTTDPINIQLKLYYDIQEYQVIQTDYWFQWGYVDSTETNTVGPMTNLDTLTYWYFYFANNSNQCWVKPTGFGSGIVYYAGAYFYKSETKDWVTTQQNASVVSEKQAIYLRPNKFYFLGDNTHSLENEPPIKIYVNNKAKGLKSALQNIYKFNEVATQWKRWKNQQGVTACSAFQKGTVLTKTMMNSAAAYIGANIGDSTLGPLKLTKKMFEALENKLNE